MHTCCSLISELLQTTSFMHGDRLLIILASLILSVYTHQLSCQWWIFPSALNHYYAQWLIFNNTTNLPLAPYPPSHMVAHFHSSCLSIYNLIFPFTIIHSSICNYTFFPSALHHYHSWQQIPMVLPLYNLTIYTVLPSSHQHQTAPCHSDAQWRVCWRQQWAPPDHEEAVAPTSGIQRMLFSGNREINNNNNSYIALYPVKIMSLWHCTLSTSKSIRQSKKHK